MAITLITGLPGHGKTLYAITKYRDIAAKEGRPIYQCRIKDLKLPWPEFEPEKWETLPPNSILIIDEAQFSLPTRGKGEPVEWINNLTTHRHLGIDIVLITQDPMLIDNFARRLVDRHFHVVRKFGTHFATIHEFANGVKANVSASRNGSIRHEWRYPKDVFDLYHSAEKHTVKSRVPMRVWIFLALPLVVGAMVWFGYQRLKPDAVAARMSGAAPGASAPGAGGGVARAKPDDQKQTVGEFVASYVPRIDGLPHTAPVYDEVTKPMEAPFPAACVVMGKRCGCYSQQATKLSMPDDMCRQIVAGGFFVAWKANGQADIRHGVPIKEPEPASNVAVSLGSGYGMAERREVSAVGAPLTADPATPQPRARKPGA